MNEMYNVRFAKVWRDILLPLQVANSFGWGQTLSKNVIDNFKHSKNKLHCHWSDEFQIPNLRKAVTLAVMLSDRL